METDYEGLQQSGEFWPIWMDERDGLDGVASLAAGPQPVLPLKLCLLVARGPLNLVRSTEQEMVPLAATI